MWERFPTRMVVVNLIPYKEIQWPTQEKQLEEDSDVEGTYYAHRPAFI
jgi:hypothetical protein